MTQNGDDSSGKRPDDYDDLMRELSVERRLAEVSEKLSDSFVEMAKNETTEAYFEGRFYEGVFIDSHKSTMKKLPVCWNYLR